MDVSIEERQRRTETLRLYGEWGAATGSLFDKPNDPELRARLRTVLAQLTLLGDGEHIPKAAWDLCDEIV